ncbi:MAG: exo-alpha-sialidase [Bacteroidales bacterium]|nr:exo-alpha-sialidase [Bacteroidales bacterium]
MGVRFFSILCCLLTVQIAAGQTQIHSIDELNGSSDVINSHAGDTYRSNVEVDLRTVRSLGENELGQQMLDYPRVKRLRDGSYIMFYQPLKHGYHVYISFSDDAVNWSKGVRVFEGYKFINGDGEQDIWKYATADALQLDNGDILCFCIFHSDKHYARHLDEFGICMKRSSDGGHTWSEEKILHRTVDWEPYPIQLEDGEILVFFTDSDWDWEPNSSGSSLLRSSDGGNTWTLQQQVARQPRSPAKASPKQRSVGTPRIPADSTRKVYTDQMPVAIRLNGTDQMLSAYETHLAPDAVLTVSLAWEDQKWPVTLTGDMTGPKKRMNSCIEGGAPYLMQFPSGEVMLSYGYGEFACRLGNEMGTDLPDRFEVKPFGNRAMRWGALEKKDAHTAIAVAAHLYKGMAVEKGRIMIGQMRLNHRVDAPRMNIVPDGKNLDWNDVKDALFIGSETNAQCSFRFAHDDNYLYILAECLDELPVTGDGLTLLLGDGADKKKYCPVFLDVAGKTVKAQPAPGVKTACTMVKGQGWMAEVAVEKAALPKSADGRIYFNAVLYKGEVSDSFTGVPTFAVDRWLPVNLL